MCFRPADVSEKITCPNCGEKINPVMGNIPKVCPFCEQEIDMSKVEAAAPQAAAPGTPAAPNAPGAPAAPKAPGAPKA